MGVPVEYAMRRFAYYGAYKLGVIGKLERFERLIRNYERRGRCLPGDVLGHYVDDVFIKLLNNTYTSLKIRGAYGIIDLPDVGDPVNNDNYLLLPVIFGYGLWVCPVTGGTCSSAPTYTCVPVYMYQSRVPLCCRNEYAFQFGSPRGSFADNAPYVAKYSTGLSGLSAQWPTTPGVVVLTFGFGGPSCLPTSGVTLTGPIIVATQPNYATNVSCASSCPSGTSCPAYQNINYCPGSTYMGILAPVMYFTASLLVLPNTSYSAWIKYQLA